MEPATIYLIIQAIVAVASVAYQQDQAKKARRKANDAAEERKGFDLVVEGEITKVPLVYGRALVGGTRVYHNTSSSFVYVTPNSDKQFVIGTDNLAGGTYQDWVDGVGDSGPVLGTKTYAAVLGSKMDRSMDGIKNEFAAVQQTICIGPINGVRDVIINNSMNIDDPALVSSRTSEALGDDPGIKSALRIDIHNGDAPLADSIITANHPGRVSAYFSGVASASMFFKLNRDDPQFDSIPDVQFILEGRKIFSIVRSGVNPNYTYALSGSRQYSTNNALCLLDYLMDPVVGKNISLDNIDLASFYNSMVVCDTIVLPSASVGGLIWQPTDGSRNITHRDIPLYECNVILDTGKKIRENVETLLDTMGDARLTWSQDRYKLVVQYPASNALISYAGDISDGVDGHDLLLGEEINIAWPSSDERLNYATVRFKDESMDFKENSVSWPPKSSVPYTRGIGYDAYPSVSGWSDVNAASIFLNKYGVWSGFTLDATFAWKFMVKTSGTHTVTATVDDNGSLTINGNTQFLTLNTVSSWTFNATAGQIITITGSAHSTIGLKGLAAKIVDSASFLVWNTRSPRYTDFLTVAQDNTLYTNFLSEDRGVQLETDVFAEGVSDYYHAMAKAESLVRTSRTAFSIEFAYKINNNYYEPGDVIKFSSDTAGLVDVPIKIDETKILEGLTASVKGMRFDAAQLAWNVDDNAPSYIKNVYNLEVTAPQWVTFERSGNVLKNSAGTVSFGVTQQSAVTGYTVYASDSRTVQSNGKPLFVEIGKTSSSPFELPPFAAQYGRVGVRTNTARGQSEMTISDPIIFNTRGVSLSPSSIGFIKNKLGVFAPASIDIVANITGYVDPVIRWYADGSLVLIGPPPMDIPFVGRTLTVDAFNTGLIKNYRLTVEESSNYGDGKTILEDNRSLFSIEEGKDVTTLDLSSSLFILPSDSQGNVSSYAGSNTTVTLRNGSLVTTNAWRITRTNSAGVSSTLAGNSAADAFSTGTASVEIVITAMAPGTDSGYVDILATKGLDTIARRFSLTKSKAGVVGNSMYNVEVFIASATQPDAPIGGTYNFSTNTITMASGYTAWSRDPPLLAELTVWKSVCLFSTSTPLVDVTAAGWTLPYAIYYGGNDNAGPAGYSNAPLTVFKRDSTTPASPGDCVYNFVTRDLTGLSPGWSKEIPSGPGDVYASSVWVSSQNATVSIASAAWSSPTKFSTDGYNAHTVYLYKRTDTSSIPAGPLATATYTFLTGELTSANLNGWVSTLPSAGGKYRWAIRATAAASATSLVDTIGTTEWSTAVIMAQDGDQGPRGPGGSQGDPGTNGTKAILVKLYQWSTVQPTLYPTGGDSVFTWSSMSLAMPPTANGWTTSITANSGVPGLRLWTIQRLVAASAEVLASSFTWSNELIVAEASNGVGSNGYRYATPTVYAWSVGAAPAIVGNGPFTWSGGTFTAPIDWSLLPTGGNPGETLYGASVNIGDNSSTTTTNIDWTSASITARGYKGTNGGQGSIGAQGVSARRAYIISLNDSVATPATTTGTASLPIGYSASPILPTPGTNQKLFQSDGLYNPVTDVTTWYLPYISSLRVGNLAAWAVNTGSLTVDQRLTLGAGGDFVCGSFTSWAFPPTGNGFYIGQNGMLFGNRNTGPYLIIERNGNIESTQFSITNGVANFSGAVSAITGSFGNITLSGLLSSSGKPTYNSGNGIMLGTMTGISYFGITGTSSGSLKGFWINSADGVATFKGGHLMGGDYAGYSWPSPGGKGFYLGAPGLLIGNNNDGFWLEVNAQSVGAGGKGFLSMPGMYVDAAGALFYGKVAVGTRTWSTGTGFYTDSSGVMAVGSAGGAEMFWDGSTLTIRNAAIANPTLDTFTASIIGFTDANPTSGSAASSGSASVSGGKAPITYAWSFSSTGSRIVKGPLTGSYSDVYTFSTTSANVDVEVTLTATDANNRVATANKMFNLRIGSTLPV